MRIIARQNLIAFWTMHPEATASLERWETVTKAAMWSSTSEVQVAITTAKVLIAEQVWFEVAGGSYWLIVAFDFGRHIACVKFVGTHAEYDRVDALTVAPF